MLKEEDAPLREFLKSTAIESSSDPCPTCGKKILSSHVVRQPFQTNTMVQYYSPINPEHLIVLNVHEIKNDQEEIFVRGCFDFGQRKRA